MLINDIFEASSIPVHSIIPGDGQAERLDLGLRLDALGLQDTGDLIDNWLAGIPENTLLFLDDVFRCSYAVLKMPGEARTLLMGPVLFQRISGERLDRIMRDLKLPEKLRTSMSNYYDGLIHLPDQGMFERLVCVGADYLFGKGEYRVEHQLLPNSAEWAQVHGDEVRVPETPFANVAFIEEQYGLESQVMLAIADGNGAEALQKVYQLQRLESSRYDMKNLEVAKSVLFTMNAFFRKTVEQVGVHPVLMDALFNQTIHEIIALPGIDEGQMLVRKAVMGYCNLVQDHHLQGHSHAVRRVITYVNTDLKADLTLSALASEMNINPSYLSTLFRREMGMPLTDYVNRARITHAQRLLESTTQPIKSVAAQCGISDMPYFSRLFKKIAGTTPKTYREQHQG